MSLYKTLGVIAVVLAAASFSSCSKGSAGEIPDVIAMEKAALDRWGKSDPQGLLDLYAKDVTYFDPGRDKRVDGLDAMKALYGTIAGKIKVQRYDMIDPKVQRVGDVAILTYNLVDDVVLMPTGPTKMKVAWNVSTVYAPVDGQWKIVHSHFSYLKPQLAQAN
jgi:uncharacterized protein (TIGR02246 family)